MSKRAIRATDECDLCKGDGIDPGSRFADCPACTGSGRAPECPDFAYEDTDLLDLSPEEDAALAAGTHYLDFMGNVRPKKTKS